MPIPGFQRDASTPTRDNDSIFDATLGTGVDASILYMTRKELSGFQFSAGGCIEMSAGAVIVGLRRRNSLTASKTRS
jgi:hypothetical protein